MELSSTFVHSQLARLKLKRAIQRERMHLPRLALAALSVFSLASTAVTATTGSAESAHGQVPFLSPEQLAQAQGQAEKHAYQVSLGPSFFHELGRGGADEFGTGVVVIE